MSHRLRPLSHFSSIPRFVLTLSLPGRRFSSVRFRYLLLPLLHYRIPRRAVSSFELVFDFTKMNKDSRILLMTTLSYHYIFMAGFRALNLDVAVSSDLRDEVGKTKMSEKLFTAVLRGWPVRLYGGS
jgi:hypothetical protein